ncbi:MAG: glycosyltransferase family 9 protein [Longimicrobiales bacterium]
MSGTIVHAPDDLGDLIHALPALDAVPDTDVLVPRLLAPLLVIGLPERGILPLEPGARGRARALEQLRPRRYVRGILLTRSFSSALLLALAGVPERVGGATERRRLLLTHAVPQSELAGKHRAEEFYRVATGALPVRPPIPQLRLPVGLRRLAGELIGGGPQPVVAILPGAGTASRIWDADRFAALARRLRNLGARVVVLGGPDEIALTRRVAGEWAMDLGGRTDLPLLAAVLATCHVVIVSDSGPLHLAAAVGAATVSLWGAGDPSITGPRGGTSALVRHTELPCVPCVRDECPRRGRGYILPDAKRECMRLIDVDAVFAQAVRVLDSVSSAPDRGEANV